MRYVHVALLALAACDSGYSGPDPAGTHTAATPLVVHYEPRPPGIAFDRDTPSVATVAKDDPKGEAYKVTFGSCWARVKRPKTPPKWNVIDGSTCSTKDACISPSRASRPTARRP